MDSFFLLPSSFFLFCPLLLLALAALAWHSDLAQRENVLWFVGSGFVAGGAYFLALRGGVTPARLWVVAIVARLILLTAEPGDDFWRYRWEGQVQAAGFNPYLLAPNAPELAPLRDAGWEKINHKSYASVYPPGAQLAFRALAPLPPLGWKLVFLLADLGVIALLAAWRRPSLEAAAAYGWNPVVIYAFAGAVHFDVLMVLALVGAAYLLERATAAETSPRAAWTNALLSALLLGVAVALKLVPFVLVPVWFFALGWRRAPVLALVVLPLLLGALALGWPAVDPLAGLRAFGRVARTNECVWWAVELFAGRIPTNDGFQLTLAGTCGIIALVFRHDWRRAMLWLLGAVLILSPAFHPWYFAWILPFAALRGGAATGWLVFSVSSFGYFLLWLQPLPWQQPIWLRLLILLPPVVWLFLRRRWSSDALPATVHG